MEEWNRYPIQGSEPSEETPANQPEPQVPPSAPQPSPYSAYGWNQAPQGTPTPPRRPRKGGAGVAVGIIGAVCAVVIVTLSVLLVLAYQDGGSSSGGPDTLPPSSETDGEKPKLEITARSVEGQYCEFTFWLPDEGGHLQKK